MKKRKREFEASESGRPGDDRQIKNLRLLADRNEEQWQNRDRAQGFLFTFKNQINSFNSREHHGLPGPQDDSSPEGGGAQGGALHRASSQGSCTAAFKTDYFHRSQSSTREGTTAILGSETRIVTGQSASGGTVTANHSQPTMQLREKTFRRGNFGRDQTADLNPTQ